MKTVFITGASSGIGKATAEFFQQKGWEVVAAARNMKETTSRSNVFPLRMDITNLESVTAGIEKVIRRFGRIT